MAVKNLAVLGATGSIGVTTLGLVARFPERFAVIALAGGSNIELLAAPGRALRAASGGDCGRRRRSRAAPTPAPVRRRDRTRTRGAQPGGHRRGGGPAHLGPGWRARSAADAARPSRRASTSPWRTRKCWWSPVSWCARRRGAPGCASSRSTASTTPSFRPCTATIAPKCGASFSPRRAARSCTRRAHELRAVTLEQALRHPTWKMGNKITIDSSTLMNKGLEVIEAHWLFALPPEQIDVVVHPQSIVHSMVEYVDGSVLAQLGIPDMAIPISYILGYPRAPAAASTCRRSTSCRRARLEFRAPDLERFPCLGLAYAALRAGGSVPAVLNARQRNRRRRRFSTAQYGYLDIPRILEAVVDQPRAARGTWSGRARRVPTAGRAARRGAGSAANEDASRPERAARGVVCRRGQDGAISCLQVRRSVVARLVGRGVEGAGTRISNLSRTSWPIGARSC